MADSKYMRYACGCVDIHTHVVPQDFPKYMGRHPDARWPSMAAAKPCHRHVMLAGKIYRTVSHQAWDPKVRIEDMERTNVARQVLSPMPELLSYWLDGEDGSSMCRFLNETIAGMIEASPRHFSGLAAVPLQDPDRAITEVEYAVKHLKLSGVEIGSNINGTPVGHPMYKPFFQACAQLGAAVFVHPMRPAGMDRLVGPAIYEQTVAFPGEIGLSAMSMITGGTLAELPELRIAFSHGGGSLQVLIPRLQQAWEILPAVKEALAEAPREAVKRMFYDDLLYDAGAIEALVRLAGPTQVMVGTDYPFTIMDQEPAARVESLAFDDKLKNALRHDNAMRWLGEEKS
jgi:aminocarboxymuconate-semialdehyde decarboxylase